MVTILNRARLMTDSSSEAVAKAKEALRAAGFRLLAAAAGDLLFFFLFSNPEHLSSSSFIQSDTAGLR